MALTPETLPRHELVGLRVRVAESTDPSRVGIAGRVVRETTNTLVVDCDAGYPGVERGRSGVRQVPKRGTTFEFVIDEAAGDREAPGIASKPDGSGGTHPTGEGATYVTVDGAALLARPARRTEHGVDTIWR